MTFITRTIPQSVIESARKDPLRTMEWLVTNGLGGYASGLVKGLMTRRYHALLVAALAAPLGRTVMLNHLIEQTFVDDRCFARLTREDPLCQSQVETVRLSGFRLEQGLPVWRFEIGDTCIEKRVILPHHQNTTHVTYSLMSGPGKVRLRLRPAMHFRPHEAPVNLGFDSPYALKIIDSRYEVSTENFPILRLFLHNEKGAFIVNDTKIEKIHYVAEERRGYEANGNLWSPGFFEILLAKGESATLTASTEPWEVMFALSPEEALGAELERRRLLLAASVPKARSGPAAEYVLAADQFIIAPEGRVQDEVRARAFGYEMRTIIAGYHWFTDWGRDTMISLEGLTLITGRSQDAASILRAFAYYLKDGLIPNLFPEGHQDGLYHTADATLWFFHALDRYLSWTDDRPTLRLLLPKLYEIVDYHMKGTRFNIGVDEKDGLLRQGQEGYQLTWMDAKVDDWVVTPRRGKTVEINALWYNALRLLASWAIEEQDNSRGVSLRQFADRVYHSFNDRFWYGEGGYLYDVVDGPDGNDASCRPNQILAVSLHHPVLTRDRWEGVVETVRNRLLTPFGLRSLAPGHADYKANYYGDIRSRDAAYHQGTVWAWLIGPFIDAWLRLHPENRADARKYLDGFDTHLVEKGVGTIGEVFDAEPPFYPHGCIAQAWSVAEILRSWVKTAD